MTVRRTDTHILIWLREQWLLSEVGTEWEQTKAGCWQISRNGVYSLSSYCSSFPLCPFFVFSESPVVSKVPHCAASSRAVTGPHRAQSEAQPRLRLQGLPEEMSLEYSWSLPGAEAGVNSYVLNKLPVIMKQSVTQGHLLNLTVRALKKSKWDKRSENTVNMCMESSLWFSPLWRKPWLIGSRAAMVCC